VLVSRSKKILRHESKGIMVPVPHGVPSIKAPPLVYNGPKMKKEKENKFTFIDLFAGLGGIRIGFEKAGASCLFSSEWDESVQKMYENYFGEKPHGDITKISAKEVPDHDILTGGFPCQAFSIAGNRKGFADTRGTLFFEVERIIKEKKPKAVFLENVKNLTTHDQGRTFKTIISSLEELGYFVHHKVLNGMDFGVPQKRERIMIVAFRENHPFEFPTNGKRKKKTLKDILEKDEDIDPKHFLSDYFSSKLQRKLIEQNKVHTVSPSVWHENMSGNISMRSYSCALRASGSFNYLVVDGKRRLTPREMFRLQGFPDSYKIIVSDSQARKQAGNAVVVPQMEAMASAIMEAMARPPVKNKRKQSAPMANEGITAKLVNKHVN